MTNKEWALAAAYAFMAKKHKNTPLIDSYRLLGSNVASMNHASFRLFGVTMSKLYPMVCKGTAKSKEYFRVENVVELTDRGQAWLTRMVSEQTRTQITFDRCYGLVDKQGNAMLLLRTSDKRYTGHQIANCRLPRAEHGVYKLAMNAPDELKAALIERNLTNELKILECVRD